MPTSSFFLFICFYNHLLLFTGPHQPVVTIMGPLWKRLLLSYIKQNKIELNY